MNVVNAVIFLFAILAFKPSLNHSIKSRTISTANIDKDYYRNIRLNRHNKRHTAVKDANKIILHSRTAVSSDSEFKSESESEIESDLTPVAKLIITMESTEKSMRSPRRTSVRNTSKIDINTAEDNGHNNNGGNSSRSRNTMKRERNFNYNKRTNKKSITPPVMLPNMERKLLVNVSSTTVTNQMKTNHLNNNRNGKRNTNNRNKEQQQMMKLEKHQNHSKHADGKIYTDQQGSKMQNSKTSTTCRYAKSAWSECNLQTNVRTRILTLKKGESNCQQTRTMEKKCKKSCRYDKGTWSECLNGQMLREDKLKTADVLEGAGDTPTNDNINTNVNKCETIRTVQKKCTPSDGNTNKQRKERKSKGSSRRKLTH